MSLNKAKIEALEPRPARYMAADGRGLALEVQPSGVKSWRLRYRLRGRPGKVNLGRWPTVSLKDARAAAEAFREGIRQGISPAEQRRRSRQAEMRGETVAEFAKRYIREHLRRVRKDVRPMERYFERDINPALGRSPLAQVTKSDLRSLIWRKRDGDPERGIPGREQAALAIRNLLKRVWDYAVQCDVLETNPLDAIKPKFIAELSERSRVLEEAEIGVFLRALEAARIKREQKIALKLILLTLVRKSELRLARWVEFDLDRAMWNLPGERTKMGKALAIPLATQAVELLRELRRRNPRGGCLFPMIRGVETPMAAGTLNAALKRLPAKIEHFTVHDLRRTAATRLAELGYQSDWVERSLNHEIEGVKGIYNRAQFIEQRTGMLQSWADYLDGQERGS